MSFDDFRVFSETAFGFSGSLPFATSSFTAFESRSLGFARSFQFSSSSKDTTGAAFPSATASRVSSVSASPARSPPTMSAPSDAGRFAFAFAAAVTTVSRHEMLTRRLATLLASTAPSAAILAPERAVLRSRYEKHAASPPSAHAPARNEATSEKSPLSSRRFGSALRNLCDTTYSPEPRMPFSPVHRNTS